MEACFRVLNRRPWKLELDVPPRFSSLFIRYSVSRLQEKGNKTRKHSSNTMQVDSGFLKIGFRRREFEENGHAHTVLDDMLLASGLIPPVTSCEK